jgi:glycerol transport system ATP-binding protein
MARLDLVDIAHSYLPRPSGPSDYALRPINLTWDDGGAYALLGPSGSGKSTLLNILSGLVVPSQGKLLFDRADVTRLPTRDRNIAQVFQFPVIYDTMSVHDNLAFPLRNRGVDSAAVNQRVAQVADILELTPDLGKRASGLSADAKQRISMGRGLVRKDVAAILLDEPLTVIDPHLKWVLRRKLKQIHYELAITLIYVTHDQIEALTFADKVVVMNNGTVLQQGSPQDLFEEPRHTFVGHFIGSPGMNLVACARNGNGIVVDGQKLEFPANIVAKANGARLTLGIRPEYVRLEDPTDAQAFNIVVDEVEHLGGYQLITAIVAGARFMIKAPSDRVVTQGQARTIWLPRTRTKLYVDDKMVD